MVKCFWCGALNHEGDTCSACHRSLKWSPILQALLRPSIGAIMGARPETIASGHYQQT
jgi:hypothetical protein